MLRFFIQALLWLMSLLPLPLAHGLGWCIGSLMYLLPNKQRHICRTNIDLCFANLTAHERRRLLRKTLIESAKAFMELGIVWFGRPSRILNLFKAVENQSLFDAALQKETGVLLAFPHIGAWEAVIPWLSQKATVSALYRAPRLAAIEQIMIDRRQRTGLQLLRAGNRGIRKLLKALKSGQAVVVLPDQQPKSGEGIFVPFFGTPALTMVLFSKIAAKTEKPTLFGLVERLPWGQGFKLHFLKASEEIFSSDLETSVTALNRDVECCARIVPAQYHWTYKRFGRRPEGDNAKLY